MMQATNLQELPTQLGIAKKVWAVASGKGGVGKTWFSITFAHALGRKGIRTLLFDADFGLANVDVQLGLNPSRDLGGVLSGEYRLDAAAIAFDGGFDVIAGRSGSGSLASMSAERLDRMETALSGVADRYDRIILDLGAGIERTVRLLAARSAVCIVMTTDEPTALTDAYAFLKLGYMSQPGADFRIVVNMAGSEAEGLRTYGTLRKACETFLKKTPELAGVVRRDEKVRDAIRHQSPLLTRHPGSKAARDVERIADRFAPSMRP